MSYIVKMPKLGLEMEQGTVLEWTVEQGDDVSEGEMIAEVESEKSIGEVEAREDGTLRRVYAEEGDAVPPGTPIGIFAAPDADIADLEAEAEAELAGDAESEAETAEAEPAEASEAVAATAETAGGGGEDGAGTGDAGESSADVKASPRAQKRAEELGVDLATVEGTGFDGAITEDDVEAAADAAESEPADKGDTGAVKASPRAQKRAEELGVDLTTVDGTGFEGAVTEDDVEAAAEAEPPVRAAERGGVEWLSAERPEQDRYDRVTATADPAAGEALFETMEAVRTAFEQRVTVTDVVLVLASATLTDHPVLNGTFTESTHQVTEPQHIALVADINGSVSGVIPDAANKSLTEIVDRRQSVDGDEEPPHQATFTVTNAAETDGSGRLINPPAVAALEVDPTGERAVPGENGVTIRPLVTASLTYDTRAVGAAEAQAFLEGFFERAQRASELVLGSYRGRE
ncbi:E3 binding domain-containing protein [Haloarcula sp. 1CSR25-25]|uniref:E3 binding domain-containing protein n=1 Tax=Haloarcula sp. 1CSR25-25 TaxID=2862545 RepID=UPI002894BAAF|nr:E3 binding domain-containing protein [Haloarcula sp. 1CSR25-25]MDT3433332.1 E3 binding domain-containing protein [Haloarcula sp. 1CSR25-25]